MLCCCSVTKSCPILCYPMDSSMPGFPVRHHLPKFAQTHTHWVNDAIQPSHPLSSSSPAFNLSQHQGLLQWVNSSHQVVKLLEFQLHSINIQGYFFQDWYIWSPCSPRESRVFSNTTVHKDQFFWHSAFIMVQLSHPYMTTGKTIVLTRGKFVGKVTSLLFNMLSGFVIAFLPRSKCLLISWLQSPSAVILEPKKIKVCHCFHCFPIYLPWSDGTGCDDCFLNPEF